MTPFLVRKLELMVKLCSAFSIILLTSSVAFGATDLDEPPKNEFLADSPWPMTHRNPYCQASTSLRGPSLEDLQRGLFSTHLASAEAVSITLNFSQKNAEGFYSLWASARNSLFKLNANDANWARSSEASKPGRTTRAISGAYTILDRDGNFFVPRGPNILIYREKSPGVPRSEIIHVKTMTIPDHYISEPEEIIVGINMTYDGHVAAVTSRSLVLIFSRDGQFKLAYRLSESEEVSNSLAIDEDGGIYVVTHKKIYRLNWLNQNLTLAWSAEYPSSDEPLPGRLGRGSGTTPTLMGHGAQDKLVVIADGSKLMNIIAFWRDAVPGDWRGIEGFSHRVAGLKAITFGHNGVSRTVTEQSLLVRGYEAVAVNNDYGDIATDERSNFWTILFSNTKKYAPYGIEKFRWDAAARQLKTAWANPELSVPNGIPAMSSQTNLIYYIGQHNERWTVEAVDWSTGKLEFRHVLGDSIKFNSFFAGMEIGYDADLVSGVVGGALRLTK